MNDLVFVMCQGWKEGGAKRGPGPPARYVFLIVGYYWIIKCE